MIIGYARVSTSDQNPDLQKDALKKIGCDEIFTDTYTGRSKERPELNRIMAMIRKGDILIVWRLDRLSRSLKDLISIVNELKEKEVEFKSLQESIDTGSTVGRLTFHIFGAIAEFERNLIRERVLAGLASARARGRLGGRKKLLDEDKIRLLETMYNSRKYSMKEICTYLNISDSTAYKTMRDNGILTDAQRIALAASEKED